MDDPVLFEVSLHGFQRCQLGCAVRQEIKLDAPDTLGGREDSVPGDGAFTQCGCVAVLIRRAIGKQQAVGLARVLLDEGHYVRAGAGGDVDIRRECQIFGLSQDVDGTADAVAPRLELDCVVVETDHHPMLLDGLAGGLEHVRKLLPRVSFVGCLDRVIADLSATAPTAAFLALCIGVGFPAAASPTTLIGVRRIIRRGSG